MIAVVAHAKEAAERHHRIRYLARALVDHQIVHGPEVLSEPVITRSADDCPNLISIEALAKLPGGVRNLW
jgi:membrane-bound ClpP family serine protease